MLCTGSRKCIRSRSKLIVDRLFRLTAFALLFISNLKLSIQKRNIETNYLSTGELQKAENIWIKSVQGKFAKNNSSLFGSRKLWRCKGR